MKKIKKRYFGLVLICLVVLTAASSIRQSPFFEIAKQIEIFTSLYKEVNMNYVDQTNPAHLMTIGIKAMLSELDPYTNYYNEQQVQQARLQHAGEYSGIGAVIRPINEQLTVCEITDNSPAAKAGLKVGDKLLKIDNSKVSPYTSGASQLLKGVSGSRLQLSYLRQGKTYNTELIRQQKQKKLVPFSQLLPGNIGYLVLTSFGRSASSEVRQALEKMKDQGATKIILDLRNNPGGLLQEAVEICNLFVPKNQLIVETKSKIKTYNNRFVTKNKAWNLSIPLVILINGKSASASEIVAGSLQDLDRAVIVGSRSFGKGLVQQPKKLPYGTQMKITIARYYTPSGRCIQALDYWHRDENGNPVRKKENQYQTFETKNGRIVYDGGGITPDILLPAAENEEVVQALRAQNIIFSYATHFYYQHDFSTIQDFKFTEEDYKNFISFVKNSSFNYSPATEKKFEQAFEQAKKEDLTSAILPAYEKIMQSITKAKSDALESKKEKIKPLLIQEILPRYFYEKGTYIYATTHNLGIKKGKEVLTNAVKYAKILH